MIDLKTKLKASGTNELRLLLQDVFLFRAAVVFVTDKRCSLYGHEHSYTYNQVRSGNIPEIILNAEKGFWDLVRYIDKEVKKGLVKSAKIYLREAVGMPFSILLCSWYNGKWELFTTPFFTDQNTIRKIDFEIINGMIEILSEEGGALPDFKNKADKEHNEINNGEGLQ
jgi:hypothetical protein